MVSAHIWYKWYPYLGRHYDAVWGIMSNSCGNESFSITKVVFVATYHIEPELVHFIHKHEHLFNFMLMNKTSILL